MFWLKDSNRPKHLAAGLQVYVVTIVLIALLYVYDLRADVVGIYVSAVAGFVAEFKDRLHNTKFDPLDLLATVLPSLVGTLLHALVLLILYLL